MHDYEQEQLTSGESNKEASEGNFVVIVNWLKSCCGQAMNKTIKDDVKGFEG